MRCRVAAARIGRGIDSIQRRLLRLVLGLRLRLAVALLILLLLLLRWIRLRMRRRLLILLHLLVVRRLLTAGIGAADRRQLPIRTVARRH